MWRSRSMFSPEVREAAGAFALVITAFMAEKLNEDEWITNFLALESAFDITAARWLVRRAPVETRVRGLVPLPSDGPVLAQQSETEIDHDTCWNCSVLLEAPWRYCVGCGQVVETAQMWQHAASASCD